MKVFIFIAYKMLYYKNTLNSSARLIQYKKQSCKLQFLVMRKMGMHKA